MLSLLWGVRGYYYNKFVSTDDTINDIIENLKMQKLISEGDLIINIASMPIKGKGMSNMLKLSEVG
jgi:pyruvate kinase